MAGVDTSLTRLRVSATLAGTYTTVGYVNETTFTEGSEGGGTDRYFGGELVRAGNPTVSGTMNVFWVRGDTLGQDVLRSAKRAGTTVGIQLCPEGTTTGSKVEQVEAYVTEVVVTSVRANNWVTGTFSYTGLPSTLSTVTLS